MNPNIIENPERKIVGIKHELSLTQNTTAILWKEFMSNRSTITDTINNHLIAANYYPQDYYTSFNPQKLYTKWAAVEVDSFSNIPIGMDHITIPKGLYAIFIYQGLPQNAAPFFMKIFNEWLPASNYILDNRPHLEILGDQYKNNSIDSQEEIWIPISPKS